MSQTINQTIYSVMEIKESIINLVPNLMVSILILIIGFFAIKILMFIVRRIFKVIKFDESFESFIDNVIKTVLWLILIVSILAVLGVNVSALLAGLGIIGFIVGFALKDTLGNLASGVFILFYKPFKVGDIIETGGTKGEVKTIGIAACTLRSPDGVKITIPNSKIWGDVIENKTGNKTRKLFNLTVGISYSDDIGKAIKIINTILGKDKRVLKDPAPQVVVTNLNDSSVDIGVRPTVKVGDYWDVYFDTTRKIKEEFDKNKINIPFPQREVWIKEHKKKK